MKKSLHYIILKEAIILYKGIKKSFKNTTKRTQSSYFYNIMSIHLSIYPFIVKKLLEKNDDDDIFLSAIKSIYLILSAEIKLF